ncbi:MAG: hypothetical protein JWM68_5022 [Verrucomicrobiales bacterium]|nr:hypothetical protein [Verrucomicrobiales bacterium]
MEAEQGLNCIDRTIKVALQANVNFYIKHPTESQVLGPFTIAELNRQLEQSLITLDWLATGDVGETRAQIEVQRARDWVALKTIPEISHPSLSKEEELKVDLDVDAPSSLVRVVLFFVAWGAVIFLMGLQNLVGVLYFPAGLLIMFPKGSDLVLEAGARQWPCAIGWIFYIVFCLTTFLAKRRGVFYLLYAILIMLLIINVAGCKSVMNRRYE